MINKTKTKFNNVFDMIDFKSINFYFDMIIFKNRKMHIIRFNQETYIQRVVKKFDLQNAKSIRIFMKKSFDSIFNVNQIIDQNIKQYQTMINSIMFAMIKIKSNVTNAIFIINRFVQNFNFNYIKTIKRVIIYFNFTIDFCIIYDDNFNKKLNIKTYCDCYKLTL